MVFACKYICTAVTLCVINALIDVLVLGVSNEVYSEVTPVRNALLQLLKCKCTFILFDVEG